MHAILLALALTLGTLPEGLSVTPEERNSTDFKDLETHYEKVVETCRQKSWTVAARWLKAMKDDVSYHERNFLKGKRSAAARAVLADAEKQVAAGSKQLTALKRLQQDPEHARLEAQQGKVAEEIAEYEQLWKVDVANGCSSKGGKACELEKKRTRLDQAYDALARKYGVELQ